ncbi:hypothetical protein H5410_031010 [Solanum commersonii]|uniref:Uncharacterized protein n=1 Tax=Solanum commersonii TaxID=4109 RepID=A0A9J5YJ12_SOLCO|nr:hypothetical protein H5410_031010 [Solanum commersonii]
MCRLFVEDEGVTSISLILSWGYSSAPSPLSDQDWECQGGLTMLGPYGHLLLYEESQINALPGYDSSKAGRIRVA